MRNKGDVLSLMLALIRDSSRSILAEKGVEVVSSSSRINPCNFQIKEHGKVNVLQERLPRKRMLCGKT